MRRGLSYLLGILLGLLLLLAVWVLSSFKWRLDEAGVTPLPMRLGRDLWPGFGPLLACVSLLDLVSDVIMLLTFLRLQQWGLICTMALLLGVAWGVMLRTIASELPASRRSLSLREVGSPPGLGFLSTPRSGAGSTSASQISEAQISEAQISETSCGASPCGSRRGSTSPGDTTWCMAGARPAPSEGGEGDERTATTHARRLAARLRSMLRGVMARDWAGMVWLTSARLTLARLESAPMFCLLMVLISVEGFRVVVEDLQFLLLSALLSLLSYLLNATIGRCQKEFVKDARRAEEAGWDDVRFVSLFALHLGSSLGLTALAFATFSYALGLGYYSWLLLPAAAVGCVLASERPRAARQRKQELDQAVADACDAKQAHERRAKARSAQAQARAAADTAERDRLLGEAASAVLEAKRCAIKERRLRRRAASQSMAAVLTIATLGVVHDAYEALFPDRGRHRATLLRHVAFSTATCVTLCVVALQGWMPHPHRDVGFIEIASRLMTLLLTTKLLSFALLYNLTEILTPPPPAFSQADVGSRIQLSAFSDEDVGRSVEIEISPISELPDPSYLRVGGESRQVRWARVPKSFSGKLAILEVDEMGHVVLEGTRQLENPEMAGSVLVFRADHPGLAGTVAAGTVAAGTVLAGGQGQGQGQGQEQEQKQGQGQAALRHVVWERRPPKLLGRLTITKVDTEPPYALTLEMQSAPPEAGLEISETNLEMQSERQSPLETNELKLENPGRATVDYPEPLAPASQRARRLHCRAWTGLCISSAASVAPRPYAALEGEAEEEEEEGEGAEQQLEARAAHLHQMAVRRFGKASLARGWHAWLDSRQLKLRHAHLLAAAGGRLARSALAAALAHWRQDSQAAAVAKAEAEVEAAVEAVAEAKAAAEAKVAAAKWLAEKETEAAEAEADATETKAEAEAVREATLALPRPTVARPAASAAASAAASPEVASATASAEVASAAASAGSPAPATSPKRSLSVSYVPSPHAPGAPPDAPPDAPPAAGAVALAAPTPQPPAAWMPAPSPRPPTPTSPQPPAVASAAPGGDDTGGGSTAP